MTRGNKAFFEKFGKVLIMRDFNARVGKYQNIKISERGSLSIARLKGLYYNGLWKNIL